MKITIRWNSGNIQIITGICEHSEFIKKINSLKIFNDKGMLFSSKGKTSCLNFKHAEQIEIEEEEQ